MSEPSAPRLVAVTGAMSGEVFSLSGPEVTFGRDAANAICFPDAALSRRHCVFTHGDGGWTVRDLGSANGTFVNGVQVSQHALAEGDRISVGHSVLLFVEDSVAPVRADMIDGDVITPTMRLPVDQTQYLDRAAAPGTKRTRVEEGLRALLTIGTVIHALRTEDDLHRELLALIREAVPAESAAVIMLRSDGELHVSASWNASAPDAVNVNRTIVRRVIAERAGILSRDAAVSGTFASDRMPSARSVMCVPVAAPQSVPGAIYLCSSVPSAFDEEHLQLVTAVARIAAIALENVRHMASLESEADRLQADLQLTHNLVGESPPMQQVYDRLARLARADTTVLVMGETGTGKELAARAVHLNSGRARRPFVAINCAALTESLLESELFGHERGAFTGAVAQKKGKFELAEGGTLFLDEVGELAPPLQSKLLRVLQEREFERVGGTRPIKVDVRLISATNRSLLDDIRAGRFREDLYFRLNVISVQMPALRERPSDIPLLARHFLNRAARKAGRRLTGISEPALACLMAYEWPGNVRELENTIERAAVLGATDEILREDLPAELIETSAAPTAPEDMFHSAVLESKRRAIVQAFRAAGGSYTEAARLLGIHPNYLHRLVKNLGLKSTLAAES